MNKELIIDKQLEINFGLFDILEYTTSALTYLKTNNEAMDKDEIIIYLSCVPEIVAEIQQLLSELLEEKKDE